ncbi:hypothetical protein Acsp06_62750 [Actinomycetospora sp. NBRC 106375]|nr:hypothetical protein Acsp06_62750 [Actinomycetospora sp. NBRC 106375]
MSTPQSRASGGPRPANPVVSPPSERVALAVIATGVLVLPTSTVVQVLWLVAFAGGALSALVRSRGSAPESSSPPGGA